MNRQNHCLLPTKTNASLPGDRSTRRYKLKVLSYVMGHSDSSGAFCANPEGSPVAPSIEASTDIDLVRSSKKAPIDHHARASVMIYPDGFVEHDDLSRQFCQKTRDDQKWVCRGGDPSGSAQKAPEGSLCPITCALQIALSVVTMDVVESGICNNGARYGVPVEVELSAVGHDETYKDQRSGWGEVVVRSNNIKWFDMKEAFFKWCRQEGIHNPQEAALALLPTRVVQAEPLGVGQSAEVCAKIEEEVADE
ncbi:hypothetical protein ACLOJK_010895 [Asimina triloba]